MNVKTPDEWAREFKLHHCIGNKKFAAQIRRVQKEAYQAARQHSENEAKKFVKSLDSEG